MINPEKYNLELIGRDIGLICSECNQITLITYSVIKDNQEIYVCPNCFRDISLKKLKNVKKRKDK